MQSSSIGQPQTYKMIVITKSSFLTSVRTRTYAFELKHQVAVLRMHTFGIGEQLFLKGVKQNQSEVKCAQEY